MNLSVPIPRLIIAFKNYGGHFDPEQKQERLQVLESLMNEPNFWSNENSSNIISEVNSIKHLLDDVSSLKKDLEDNLELVNLLKEESDDDLSQSLEDSIPKFSKRLNDMELLLLLNGPYDTCDCILELHPGAGGTESCDWASMLYRMYTRYCEKHHYKLEEYDYQSGDEAGLKSVAAIIHGDYAYGYLKCEKGVHRLIRLSPFDANNRRHTSFASVDITPIYNQENIDIEIKESDVRIDVYRSSGKGGQGVNTTDSAVRITHLPTKIVVTCQNERSQIRNKEIALNVLKNKLYQLEIEKREKELQNIKGQNADINFGSQIRTYTLHPYSLVKDHRTNYETGNVVKVLDGDLDEFINECLKRGVN